MITQEAVIDIAKEAIYTMIITVTPLLLVSLIVGLIVSIFQTVTSIQEQTLTFLPKMLVILAMLALLGGWMFASLRGYTLNLFDMIPKLAQ